MRLDQKPTLPLHDAVLQRQVATQFFIQGIGGKRHQQDADLDTIRGEINALAQVRSGISDLLDAFQQLEQECGTEVQLAEGVERVSG